MSGASRRIRAAQAQRSAAFGNHPEHGTFCVLGTRAL